MTADEQRTATPAGTQAQAVWLVIGGIVSVQVGAAIAKDLFPLIPPTAMVWLRLLTSALILVAILIATYSYEGVWTGILLCAAVFALSRRFESLSEFPSLQQTSTGARG